MGHQFRQAVCIFSVLCLFGISKAGKLRHTRAINGKPAEPGEFPYTVILTDEDGFLHCGGVLISDQSVLTTALCLESYEDPSEVRVRLGTNRWTGNDDEDSFVEAIVDNSVPHPDFDMTELTDDIAIVNMFAPVLQSTKVRIACLSSSTEHVGQNATFSGWGYLGGGARNEVLHKLDLEVITTDECERKLDITLDNKALCTWALNKDICAGDQGGPLTIPNDKAPGTVIGVASWTTCTAGVPAVFTNVGHYLAWIKETMAGGNSCFA